MAEARALKTWEKDGKWGIAVEEDLVPEFSMTRQEALEAVNRFYALGGRSAEEHTDEFHAFYAQESKRVQDLLETRNARAKDGRPASSIERNGPIIGGTIGDGVASAGTAPGAPTAMLDAMTDEQLEAWLAKRAEVKAEAEAEAARQKAEAENGGGKQEHTQDGADQPHTT